MWAKKSGKTGDEDGSFHKSVDVQETTPRNGPDTASFQPIFMPSVMPSNTMLVMMYKFVSLWPKSLRGATLATVAVLFTAQAHADSSNYGQQPITHDISWINPSDASALSMENAAADTMPGKLRAYRDAQLDLAQAVQKQYIIYGEYQRLLALSPDEITRDFPHGTYLYTLSVSATTYGQLRREALMAEDTARASLQAVIGDRRLSDAAMADLHTLLGL